MTTAGRQFRRPPPPRGALQVAAKRAQESVFRPLSGFPFTSRRNRRLIVHCCHHRVGTVWFKNVLRRVSEHFELPYQACQQAELRPGTAVFVQHHSQVEPAALPAFRGSHIIRDPRDVVVSGYFYHLRCDERWALQPDPRLGGLSYQEYLRTLDQEEGIRAEMDVGFARRTLPDMVAWDYRQPAFLELRYEEFVADEDRHWERLFRHYGFREGPARKAALIARRYSLSSERYRQWRASHIRSGQPGEWRTYFSDAHRGMFRDLFGDALQLLGYERDDNW